MPEAAEVETLRRQLLPYLPLAVDAVEVRGHRSVRAHEPSMLQDCVGVTFNSVARKGKWLGLHGEAGGVRLHLRMSGRLHLVARDVPLSPHDHVVFDVEGRGGRASLRFFDPRTFGEVALWDGAALGSGVLDVLEHGIADAFTEYRSARSVKSVLLDQRSVVQGLGNIYADEVCHLARVDPAAIWTQLTPSQKESLAKVIPTVIEDSVCHRGTALADEGWLDLFGQVGGHGPHLHVHARQACADCGAAVERFKLAGRSTYRCPACLRTT